MWSNNFFVHENEIGEKSESMKFLKEGFGGKTFYKKFFPQWYAQRGEAKRTCALYLIWGNC